MFTGRDGIAFQIPQGQRALFPEVQPEWLDGTIGALFEIVYQKKLLAKGNYTAKTLVLRAKICQEDPHELDELEQVLDTVIHILLTVNCRTRLTLPLKWFHLAGQVRWMLIVFIDEEQWSRVLSQRVEVNSI
jgi:hypothetical protein